MFHLTVLDAIIASMTIQLPIKREIYILHQLNGLFKVNYIYVIDFFNPYQ
jgi:hypothetical protein